MTIKLVQVEEMCIRKEGKFDCVCFCKYISLLKTVGQQYFPLTNFYTKYLQRNMKMCVLLAFSLFFFTFSLRFLVS